MRKIPTLFERDESRRYVTRTVTSGCEWVLRGEGVATRKWDGTCVMFDGVQWWFRREVKAGKTVEGEFVPVETDPVTGKTFGWEKESSAGFGPLLTEARHALDVIGAGTYELCGPKINGNPEGMDSHGILRHGSLGLYDCPTDIDGILAYVAQMDGEGIVWWHEDGRKAKLKKRDIRGEG